MHGHEFLLYGDAWNGSRLRVLFAYSTGLHRRGQWRADGNMAGADDKAPVLLGQHGGGGGSRTCRRSDIPAGPSLSSRPRFSSSEKGAM